MFADVRGDFTGHEICDSSSWLHSVNFLDISESYHPTASGQSGAYEPVFSKLRGLTEPAARRGRASTARPRLQDHQVGMGGVKATSPIAGVRVAVRPA